MKKTILGVLFIFSATAFALPSTSGATGNIDFPDAYNLRINNYTVAAAVTGIDSAAAFQLMIEGGFIPQLEAGIVLSSKDTMINESLLKANVKFQFVQEADNPAIAVGFVETKDYSGSDDVYGYLVASKRLGNLLVKDNPIGLTGGMKFDKKKDTDGFIGLDIPIFSMIKIVGEGYSYHVHEKIVTGDIIEKKDKMKFSYNVGGEFYTSKSIRTKIWWKDINNTLGISIAYIGIYK